MKKNIRHLSFALVLVLLVSVFAACGGSQESPSPDASADTVTNAPSGEAAAPPADEPVSLQFMGFEGGPLEADSINKNMRVFMERNPNIKVEFTPSEFSVYHQKLLTMMAGNSAPDIFYAGLSYYVSLARRGVLYDITDRFHQDFSMDDFIPASQQTMEVDGRFYGISSCTTSPILYYNTECFDEAGLPYPSANPDEAMSWDEFVDVAKKLTKTGADGSVTQFGVFGFEDFYNLQLFGVQLGLPITNEEQTDFLWPDSPEFADVLVKIKELRTVHNVQPQATFLTQVGMSANQMLQTGKVAMILDGSWAGQELGDMGFPFGAAPVPVISENAKSMTWSQAHLHSIWEGSPNKDAAYELLKFLSSEECQMDLVKAGLWMPNRSSMYTPEAIRGWITDVHPQGFEELAMYFINNANVDPEIYFGTPQGRDISREECQAYFNSDEPLETVLPRWKQRVNDAMADARAEAEANA